ncbi:Sir2 family NAD-dependent protein deacetylase [Psychrosphaera sp. 1_MG-2023]|uniref:SIR2 family NAD-dependent protein deacylase n=1 Tax=Psychrosphaera sp. 1_MG-2023 TaxID=3062643 RepID=UPI0026E3A6B3|nr:Sir2 family NAD-dependent protein deacetylase [Psychrosphaera sp. 1_MG-2023]MDO6720258.1 Sir2 family NAD-dependent protein deacetylase [Psychrosphaera sp. 1_MG-2023]
MSTLYITGAGVSAESGIPTFRGEDGFWTIGSQNYTPQQMATREMYKTNPSEFLTWYYKRFVTYRNCGPNDVHHWLANKDVVTQNIDGLDGKAGNTDYIPIHGRIDHVTLFHTQGQDIDCLAAPWDQVDESNLTESLLSIFKIPATGPEKYVSLKPFVLLFDEFYTDLYRVSAAQNKMKNAAKIVFMGTSFSVNITQMALDIARQNRIPIEVVDPSPSHVLHPDVTYHAMTALEYISKQD